MSILDGYLLLRFVEAHAGSVVARDLCEELFRLYRLEADMEDKAKKEEGSGGSNNGGAADALTVGNGVPPSLSPSISTTYQQPMLVQSPPSPMGAQSVASVQSLLPMAREQLGGTFFHPPHHNTPVSSCYQSQPQSVINGVAGGSGGDGDSIQLNPTSQMWQQLLGILQIPVTAAEGGGSAQQPRVKEERIAQMQTGMRSLEGGLAGEGNR